MSGLWSHSENPRSRRTAQPIWQTRLGMEGLETREVPDTQLGSVALDTVTVVNDKGAELGTIDTTLSGDKAVAVTSSESPPKLGAVSQTTDQPTPATDPKGDPVTPSDVPSDPPPDVPSDPPSDPPPPPEPPPPPPPVPP